MATLLLPLLARAQELSNSTPTPVDDLTPWEAIEDMARSAGRGASILRQHLSPFGTFSYDSGRSAWTAGKVTLSDRLMLMAPEIRVYDDNETVSIATMTVTGSCISTAALRARYPNLELFDHPRPAGPLTGQPTVWSTSGDWGRLMYSFTDAAPGCVGRLSFDPFPDLGDTES